MYSVEKLPYKDSSMRLMDYLETHIAVLDGAMGTMIQGYGLTEEDFRGERFAGHKCRLKGCNDILALTRPDIIGEIHTAYLDAGAKIIETDSFNANAVSLADYGLEKNITEINLAAATVARCAADRWMAEHDGEMCWVAGSVGPTGKSLSMSLGSDVESSWDDMAATLEEQCSALIEGGVDLFLIETSYDALNCKAALYGARRAMEQAGVRIPVIVSMTLMESGRTLAGQTPEAFITSIKHAGPLAVGLNCSFGADSMATHVETVAAYPYYVIVYPNAGLPNELGEYDQTPEIMAAQMEPMMSKGLVNIVGGCCGTTPQHIAAIAAAAARNKPRRRPEASHDVLALAGLEPLYVEPSRNFVNVGERCNVAGSRKFLRLIKNNEIAEAVSIARSQVEAGAQIIDINMDDAMLDAPVEMSRFLSCLGTEPDIARVPFMIDSSDWAAVEGGLKHVQGRPIVNSISLKEGEAKFISKAGYVKEMGAAVVVMAFDEKGQADTFERRIEVCGRAYRILTEEVGFDGCDIVFDPNVLAVATGIESHDSYALDFINSVEWIKTHLPGAKVSGGISNLSFSFRGNTYVREAMHSVFLYHAISKGMDMGIVNAAAMLPVDEISPELRDAIEDVLLCRSKDATDRLVSMAGEIKAGTTTVATVVEHDAGLSAVQMVENMLVKGVTDNMEDKLAAAMKECGSAMAVIDGPLMSGMNRVGELFGQGKLFLPQVVKSARMMKQAVSWLTPSIEEEKRRSGASSAAKMVIATVKGDVHDIGKNIVGVIMNCNGVAMIDLGVMVPGEEIIAAAEREQADMIGLSGLITPSLEEMCHVARLMEEQGMTIPLLIGGATTSALHTAVKIAPCYSGPVIYTRDAAMMPSVAQRLMNPATKGEFIAEIKEEQARLRAGYAPSAPLLSLDEARKCRPKLSYPCRKPVQPGCHDLRLTIDEVREYINWRAFLAAWKLDASLASVADVRGCDHCRAQWLASVPSDKVLKAAEAMQLLKEAGRVIDALQAEGITIGARVKLLPAGSGDDTIYIDNDGNTAVIPTLRRQSPDAGGGEMTALSDYVCPSRHDERFPDWIGVFAVTVGEEIENKIRSVKATGDDYRMILYQTVADRLAEAATELLHRKVRRELWGYAVNEPENPDNLLVQYYEGIRPAIGYPSLPDQSLIFVTDTIIDYASMGITITESGAMSPASSTTGLMLSHPDSRYFIVGDIDETQREDYAGRRGIPVDELRRFLSR